MDNIRTILCDMPVTVRGYTIATPDGFFTIVLNSSLSHAQNVKTYEHELGHIMRGDFDSKSPVGLIEAFSHAR